MKSILLVSAATLVACLGPATGLAGTPTGPETQVPLLSSRDMLNRPAVPFDHRIPYGYEAEQFGDLRLPDGSGPFPVVVVIHGGCWLAEYGLDHIDGFCAALTRAGVATWNLEYRRVGQPGGGWPNTFRDVARGIDHLRALARIYPLDIDRVVVVGHSAGGHLALWAAARHRLPADSPLHSAAPLRLRGVVSLAGLADLTGEQGACEDTVIRLMGGNSLAVPERYRQASPREMPPPECPVVLIHGRRDTIVPSAQSVEYATSLRAAGGAVTLIQPEDAGHFELIAPESTVWPTVRDAVLQLLPVTPTSNADR